MSGAVGDHGRRLAGVIGSPVGHSRSPALMQAAFDALDIDWDFFAFEVPAGAGAAAVDAMRVLGIQGLSVTMPLKGEVMEALDHLSSEAAALGAVNCISWADDVLVGHNTDGGGFVDSLLEHDVDPGAGSAVIFGAGGAARSIVDALARAGCPDVVVVNRSTHRARSAVALAEQVARVGSTSDLAAASLVVNATSLGMARTQGAGQMPFDAGLLRRDHVVVDIVYSPLRTPLLEAADGVGARTIDGLGMLVNQAARAFSMWTGAEAPIDVMLAAARKTL